MGAPPAPPRGVWLTPAIIAWPIPHPVTDASPRTWDWVLHLSRDGGIDVTAAEPVAWDTTSLRPGPDGLPGGLQARYPHLAEFLVLRVPGGVDLSRAIQGQVMVAAYEASGALVDAGGVQLAPIIDLMHPGAARARLGPRWDAGRPTLLVWAPTARSVQLLLWPPGVPASAEARRLPMVRAEDGTWSIRGEADWVGARYQFGASVFAPSYGRVVENRVTDPYAVALSTNSTHAVLADLDDPAYRPARWESTAAPPLEHAVDQTIYELHVRDFSQHDAAVPADLRGTYLAFAADGNGTAHLRRLQQAGLTSIQLLPVFDYASAEEDRDRQHVPDPDLLRRDAPDSSHQQEAVRTDHPAHNWGYDPWHHQVPEGSLATRAAVDGPGRTTEVREMIGALHGLGLRVILDQVYNHTHGFGQEATSVLGRLVPGYYYRRNDDGSVACSTCCPTLATETMMGQKLMVDSVVFWARCYRVDGFRFDLMGHHSRDNMAAVRAALDSLTLEADGVDGSAITMHGEGWNFGEVADNARFIQASQGQLGGMGIATFSDRLRDAVRGGGPFDEDPRVQGFGTGLVTAPNDAAVNGDASARGAHILQDADLIQLGLAGTLRRFTFRSAYTRQPVRGEDLVYRGCPAGYADEPGEVLSYVDAHDNETLFDALTLKLPPGVTMADRVRANTLCLALATLGQSPVLWHAGSDFLRSKSLDRNSFASGDWFNRLDFSLTDNGFGVGLPPAADNERFWPLMRPLLADPRLRPTPHDMKQASTAAADLLRIRASSRLFRLGSAEQIIAKVTFPVSGTWAQQTGVIVMVIDDHAGRPVDPHWSGVVVAVNSNAWTVRQEVIRLRKGRWALHPVQAEGADPVLRAARCDDGLLLLPPWSAAVFVDPRQP